MAVGSGLQWLHRRRHSYGPSMVHISTIFGGPQVPLLPAPPLDTIESSALNDPSLIVRVTGVPVGSADYVAIGSLASIPLSHPSSYTRSMESVSAVDLLTRNEIRFDSLNHPSSHILAAYPLFTHGNPFLPPLQWPTQFSNNSSVTYHTLPPTHERASPPPWHNDLLEAQEPASGTHSLVVNDNIKTAFVQFSGQFFLTIATNIGPAASDKSSMTSNSKVLLSFVWSCTVIGFLAEFFMISFWIANNRDGVASNFMLKLACLATACAFHGVMAMRLPDHLQLWAAGVGSMVCFLIILLPMFRQPK